MERQQVIVEGKFSDSYSVDSGVPQGTVFWIIVSQWSRYYKLKTNMK